MMSFEPTLKINHLTVYRRDSVVFSEAFHSGLNIISGENSSGKSSIMDFLFYGLGGDLTENQWRETSLLCDRIILGIEMNGHNVALSREVEPRSMRPMEIYFGDHETAAAAPKQDWQKHPYSRGAGASGKDSFSQVLFRLLGLPEVRIEEQNVKITMHQLLRLLYSDQLSSVERIFRVQARDDANTRSTAGDILLGAYSDRFYSATLRLKEAQDEQSDVIKSLRGLRDRYKIDGRPLTEQWLNAETSKLNREIVEIASKIGELEDQVFSEQYDDRLTLNDQKSTYDRVVELQGQLGELSEELNVVEFEIGEATDFIKAMERKVGDLTNANVVVQEFEYLDFDMCPACMGVVEDQQVEEGCSLCKQPFHQQTATDRSAKMINEAIRQRDRSLGIQKERRDKRNKLIAGIAATKLLWEDASRYYTISLRKPASEMRSKLRDLNRQSGYKHRQLEEISSKKSTVEELKLLESQRNALATEIETLTGTIDVEKKRNIDRKLQASSTIEKMVLDFLHDDLDRQSTFKQADRVAFDFEGDRLSVNDESFFSASSMVYLRNSFLAAFHFAAASDPGFGHPRLLLMDTIEDKGMEQDRSKHFQRLLAKKSKEANSSHQLIIATSMIAEELNTPEYVVGEHYSHENRTLKILTR